MEFGGELFEMKKQPEYIAFRDEMWKHGIEISSWDSHSEILQKTMRDIIKKHSPEKAKKWYYDLQLLRAGLIKEEEMEKID